MSVIIGVDPGWRNLGLSVLQWTSSFRPQRPKCIHLETVRLDDVEQAMRPQKISLALVRASKAAVEAAGGDPAGVLMAIEDQKQAQVAQFKRGHFRSSNSRVNEVVGHCRGFAIGSGFRVIELPPATWKRLIGAGGQAEKKAIKNLVNRLVDTLPILFSQHASDAVGIALGGRLKAGPT